MLRDVAINSPSALKYAVRLSFLRLKFTRYKLFTTVQLGFSAFAKLCSNASTTAEGVLVWANVLVVANTTSIAARKIIFFIHLNLEFKSNTGDPSGFRS